MYAGGQSINKAFREELEDEMTMPQINTFERKITGTTVDEKHGNEQ